MMSAVRSETSLIVKIMFFRETHDSQVLDTVEGQHEPESNDCSSDLWTYPVRLRLCRPALILSQLTW